jgi:uncharacterized membrane protein
LIKTFHELLGPFRTIIEYQIVFAHALVRIVKME